MSGVALKDVATAVEKAVVASRERPDEEVTTIVNEIIAELGAPPSQVEWSKRAEDFLNTSAQRLDEMGDHPQAPLVGSLVGIGFALLAGGQDFEMLCATMAGGS